MAKYSSIKRFCQIPPCFNHYCSFQQFIRKVNLLVSSPSPRGLSTVLESHVEDTCLHNIGFILKVWSSTLTGFLWTNITNLTLLFYMEDLQEVCVCVCVCTCFCYLVRTLSGTLILSGPPWIPNINFIYFRGCTRCYSYLGWTWTEG